MRSVSSATMGDPEAAPPDLAGTEVTHGLSGEAVPGGTSYAQHFWSTTAERWGADR
jgi:hypothetical protein